MLIDKTLNKLVKNNIIKGFSLLRNRMRDTEFGAKYFRFDVEISRSTTPLSI